MVLLGLVSKRMDRRKEKRGWMDWDSKVKAAKPVATTGGLYWLMARQKL